jgi:hypothetical protein
VDGLEAAVPDAVPVAAPFEDAALEDAGLDAAADAPAVPATVTEVVFEPAATVELTTTVAGAVEAAVLVQAVAARPSAASNAIKVVVRKTPCLETINPCLFERAISVFLDDGARGGRAILMLVAEERS